LAAEKGDTRAQTSRSHGKAIASEKTCIFREKVTYKKIGAD